MRSLHVTLLRVLLLASVFANACGIARADEPAALPTSSSPVADAKVVATIGLGLTFLAKDAVAWREEHHCASCHHAALVVWSLQEAKQHGHAVDEEVLAEMTQWIADSGDGTTSLPRPEGIPKAFNEKAVSYALGLASVAAPNDASRAGAKRLLQTVKNDQLENGSWASWPETRPPLFGHSDERATLSAVLALLPAANAGEETAVAARDRGVQWLESTKSDGDPQSVALRIVLWQKLGRPAAELAPLVQIVKDRQKTDGGWSQSPEMPSDAWATGQALYALAHAGIKSEDAAVQRAQAYLAATQREDGSWPMTSRPAKPGDKPATNLMPITGAGSAWAVMGLVRSR